MLLVVEGSPSVFWSIRVYSCPLVVRLHERSAVFPRMIRTAGRAPGSRANGSFPKGAGRLSEKSPAGHSPPHRRDGIAWERGRPARILSLWPPLSFSAMLQAATLWAGTASARPKENHGAVPGRSKWGRWPRLCQAWCGRDARAPSKPSSHDIVTPRAPNCRSILVLLVVEGGPSVFWSIRVYSCPFVVRLHERSAVFPRMIRTAGRGLAKHIRGSKTLRNNSNPFSNSTIAGEGRPKG